MCLGVALPAGCNWLQGADRRCSPACYQTDGQLGKHSSVTCLTRSRSSHLEWAWPVETRTHWRAGASQDFDFIGQWGEWIVLELRSADALLCLFEACTQVVGLDCRLCDCSRLADGDKVVAEEKGRDGGSVEAAGAQVGIERVRSDFVLQF